MSTSPFEIIAGPAFVYIAPVTTSFPDTDETPDASDWTFVGRTDGGVHVAHMQNVIKLRSDQETTLQKLIRSEEDLDITFQMMNLTVENFSFTLANGLGDVTEVSGPPHTKSIPIVRGFDMFQFAMLVRGPSPYFDGNLQYEVPFVVQTENPSTSFLKDNKSVLNVKWSAISDPDADPGFQYGRLIAQVD